MLSWRCGTRAKSAALADVVTGAGEPPRRLKCFGSVFLAPKQSAALLMHLATSSLEVYQNGTWSAYPGQYLLELGSSSADLFQRANFQL